MDGGVSRVGACARLSLAREQERRRATQTPLAVPWRETRARDGRVVISLCSSSDEDENDREGEEEEEEEEGGEEEKEEGGEYGGYGAEQSPARWNACAGGVKIKQELPPGGGNVLGMVGARQGGDEPDPDERDAASDVAMDAGESSESDAVDVDLTADTDDSYDASECEHARVKTEAAANSPAGSSAVHDAHRWSPRPEPVGGGPGANRAQSSALAAAFGSRRLAAASASEWCVRKMDEVDAAFLLFYGVRETPSASVLRMIIDLIAASVGATDAYLMRLVKHVTWQKLNASVDANIEEGRAMQSEWMKIVFEEEPPRHRHRWGPMSRMPLLKRPVQITVRSMQFAANSRPLQNQSSARGRSAPVKKEPSGNKRKSLGGKGAHLKEGLPPRKGSSVKQGTATKRPLAEPREFVGSSPTVSTTPSVAPPFTPRKHHRRNGSVSPPPVTPRQILGAKGPGGRSISQLLMEPLPFDIRTLGENRSLPNDWTEELAGDDHRAMQHLPLEVDPLRHMTVRQLADHIKSVKREGHVENFDHASEILAKLMAHPRNARGLFNVPVDPVALGLDMYTTIVKNPMDLGTVKARLMRGEYIEMDAFVADVRLVFENAMLFNPKNHYVHVHADVLLQLFESAMRGESERQKKRSNPSRHVCLVCRGNQCSLCQQHCLPLVPPHMQCAGGCAADFRKGSVYYATRDGTRVYCNKCKSRMDKESDAGQLKGSQTKHGADDGSRGGSLSSPTSSESSVAPSELIKQKCEVGVEPWVRCTDCDKWLHQVCGLYNPVLGVYAREHSYVCPLCLWRRKSATQAPEARALASRDPAVSPSWGEALAGLARGSGSSPAMDVTSGESSSSVGSSYHFSGGRDDADKDSYRAGGPDECAWSSGANIPSCDLSDFIQGFLERELRAVGEDDAADTLYVRALSFPHERMSVSDGVFRVFAENSDALAQLRPDAGVRAARQRLPRHISYLSRSLYLFQKHDGVDVCLFTLYAQEFGDACELPANRRSVYIAYLDSVRYLSPPSARTAAYHLIMLAYFDYIRRHGFRTVHIWSCPPQKRISYVFWCRPPFQKTPSADHLRLWYKNLLAKARDRRIVAGWTTTFERYFSAGDSASGSDSAVVNGGGASGIATRGVTARSLDPSELEWPAPLPPLFDGDLVPTELNRVLGRIVARNEKVSRAASASPFLGKGAAGATGGKRVTATGDAVARVKVEHAAEGTVEPALHVDVKLRDMFAKCQTAVRNLRNDLLVVDLAVDGESDAALLPCRPEALAPGWCARVPRFFGSRFMFHQLCSHAGYQFDSLRRAKHSTMMLLHHYFNERAVAQNNVFCRECSLLITHVYFWACAACDGLALCDACHRRVGPQHPHAMRFGQRRSRQSADAAANTGLLGL